MNALVPAIRPPDLSHMAEGLEGFNEVRRSHAPTDLVWPPTLPIELALKTGTPREIQLDYGYDDDQWEALRHNRVFLKDLADACELVKQEGMSFKLKAKLQAEELLKTSWRLIHAPGDQVPPSVKKDLILATARWAGFDPKTHAEAQTGAVQANTLNIQINLPQGY